MNKSPAYISILALLLSSQVHLKALLKVLKETHVPTGIINSTFEGMVSLVLATNQVSFLDNELPLEGRDHTLAMHTIVKCEDMIVVRVLIDNRSTLNVCLMATLKHLKMDMSLIWPSTTIIKAFDGTCREVQGKIELIIEISSRLSIQYAFREALDIGSRCNRVYSPSETQVNIRELVDHHYG